MNFQHEYPMNDGYFVRVTREENGQGWDSRILVQLCADFSGVEVAQVRLRSLEPLSYSGFTGIDFVQHGLKSVEPGKGHAHRLHDFLIASHQKFPFEVRNIFSTNPNVDNLYFVLPNQPRLYISESAIRFWNKRLSLQKAEYSDVLKRYRIKWNDH
jgi:hypothetical protein